MKIGYNKLLTFLFMGGGAINVVLGGWLLLLGRFGFSIVIGILLLGLAALYLTRPYFTIEKNQIAVGALVGPLTRTYFFTVPEDVKVDGGKLYVRDDTRWKRVPVQRWMSDPADWNAMESKLAAGSPAQTA